MAKPVRFVVHFLDLEGVRQALNADIDLHPGETREDWVRDVTKNGFRVELGGEKGMARRYSANRVLAVDYAMA